ncbi:MAG TPA: hypothetical protein VHU81_06715 [Thermoanaerobaculia bacterium]|nr:hypothetical protein [Thermoanaerobaculia bacterium]
MGDVRTLICALLLGMGLAPASFAAQPAATPSPATEPAAPRVNARQLLAVVRDNLAQASHAAVVSRIDREHPRYTPFWSTFDQMAAALDHIGAAMRDRSPALISELRGGTRALEAMGTVWRWSGRDEPAVTAALDAVAVSYRLLRGQYGPEALRARQPDDLTAAERRQLQAWQRIQRRLAARLEVLEAEAVRQRDRRMQEELRRLHERASRLAFAPVTLDSYLDAAESNDEVQGEWDGASYYVDPENGPIWEDTYEVVEELSVEEEDSPMVVMAANLTTGESWSFLDYETDLPVEILPLDDVTADASTPAPIPAEPIAADEEIWAVQGLSGTSTSPGETPVVETVETVKSVAADTPTPETTEPVEPGEKTEAAATDSEAAKVEEGEKAWPEHTSDEEALTVEDIEEAQDLTDAKAGPDGKTPTAAETDSKAAASPKPEKPEKKDKPAAGSKAKAKASSKPPKKSSPARRPTSH